MEYVTSKQLRECEALARIREAIYGYSKDYGVPDVWDVETLRKFVKAVTYWTEK